MAKIFLSFPILDKPEFKCVQSIYQAIANSKHDIKLYSSDSDSLISRVRNIHLSKFMQENKDCDYFCSIDSDLYIHNSTSMDNVFDRLVEGGRDFTGGVYALKGKFNPAMCSSVPKHIRPDYIKPDSGEIEMEWLSSGCWMIRRTVVETMIKKYPELTYRGDGPHAGLEVYGLFIPSIFDVNDSAGFPCKKYLSEDWAFCSRWNNIGGKIYADTSIKMTHIGKTCYDLW